MKNETITQAIREILGSKAAGSYVSLSESGGTVSLKAGDLRRVIARAVTLAEDERTEQAMRTAAELLVQQEEDEDAAAAELARGL